MEYVNIANLGLKSSRIGFGCCPLGGHGWGDDSNPNEMIAAIYRAIELGINFFDTADVYGLGLSETRLGQAIQPYRDKIIIASKFGVRFNTAGERFFDNSSDWLITALNNSLKRLNTDYIDLYQVHYWDNVTPFEEIRETLERLIQEGKIRSFGVTNIDLTNHECFLSSDFLASYSFEYSLIKRNHELLINKTLDQKQDLTFLSWGSLAQGLLSGKYGKETVFLANDRRSREVYDNFHGEQFNRNLQLIEQLKYLQFHFYPEKSISQLAIRWILDSIPSSIALIGIKNIKQIEDVVKGLGWNLQVEHMKSLTQASNTPA